MSGLSNLYTRYCPNFPPSEELADLNLEEQRVGLREDSAIAIPPRTMDAFPEGECIGANERHTDELTQLVLDGPANMKTELTSHPIDTHAEEEVSGNGEEEHTCKICYENAETSDQGNLVRPCACRGSAAYIHIGCLKQWHMSLGNPTTLRCPTCKQAYVGHVAIELAEMNVKLVEEIIKEKMSNRKERAKWKELHATVLTQHAQVLSSQGKYGEALPLFQRSLDVRIKLLGPERLEVAESLDAMAELYRMQGQYDEALRLKRRALHIREKVLGADHPGTATSYNNIGLVLQSMDKLDEAKPYFENAVAIYSRIYGPEHPNLASLLNNLAGLLRNQGKYAQAVELYKRSLAIRVKVLGPEHPIAAESLNNLAIVLSDMGELEEAERMSKRCLVIAKSHYHVDHPEFVNYRGNYGIVLKAMGKKQEARKCMEEALEVLRRKDFHAGHVWLVKFQTHLDAMVGTHTA